MYDNQFKAALAAGRPQIGLWLSLANACTAEICASAGFDWLLLDCEHAPNDVRSMLAQLQAVARLSAQPVVRPVGGDVALIKQLLDIGAQTLLVPMVDTAEQARAAGRRDALSAAKACAASARHTRASRWDQRADYLDRPTRGVPAGAGRDRDGAAQPRCDLRGRRRRRRLHRAGRPAASLGHRGKPGHPKCRPRSRTRCARIVACGKAAGTLTSDNALARRYLELGCTYVAVGLDVRLLATGARALRAEFADGAPAQPASAAGAVY